MIIFHDDLSKQTYVIKQLIKFYNELGIENKLPNEYRM